MNIVLAVCVHNLSACLTTLLRHSLDCLKPVPSKGTITKLGHGHTEESRVTWNQFGFGKRSMLANRTVNQSGLPTGQDGESMHYFQFSWKVYVHV